MGLSIEESGMLQRSLGGWWKSITRWKLVVGYRGAEIDNGSAGRAIS